RAGDVDTAAVVGGDVLDDGQAQAGAAGRPGPGLVSPVEPLEDPVDVVRGDTDALVGDVDLDPVIVLTQRKRNLGVLPRVRDRVLHEVGHRGRDLAVAAVHHRAFGAGVRDLDALGGGRGAGAVYDLGDHPVDRDRLGRGQRLGALQSGELEQLVHQA